MTQIDEVLRANETYASSHEVAHISPKPKRRLAVLTCMDTRLTNDALGLGPGDAHVIRNAGGIVTDDAVRSLLISYDLLEAREFMIINHTDCGLTHASEEELLQRVRGRSGTDALSPARFHAFKNLDENVRHQMQRLRLHPWVPKEVPVRGFVFDVTTGRLREIR